MDPCATLSARPYNAEKHEDKRVAEGWPEVEGSFSIRRRFRFSEGRRVGEGEERRGWKARARREKREREEETTERVDDDVPRPRVLSPSGCYLILSLPLSLSLSLSPDPFGWNASLVLPKQCRFSLFHLEKASLSANKGPRCGRQAWPG